MPETTTCPACGAESSGRFCSECGAPLKPGTCTACGAPLQPGARFCTRCGAPVADGRGSGGLVPWLVGAVAVVALAFAVFLVLRGNNGPLTPGAEAAGAAAPLGNGATEGSAAPGPLTGTPREQADRLFNRIMELRAQGDTARSDFFVPMGIQAYEIAGELDADGLYHLSLLQDLAGDPAAARATAERILADDPSHLLGLAAAAEAATDQGDAEAARAYWRRFLGAYDDEIARDLPEYGMHSAILPVYREEAREATAP